MGDAYMRIKTSIQNFLPRDGGTVQAWQRRTLHCTNRLSFSHRSLLRLL